MPSLRTEQLALELGDSSKHSGLLRLKFGEEVTAGVRPRILYALRVFAAVYGYGVSDRDETCITTIFYGAARAAAGEMSHVCVPALYRADLIQRREFQFTKRQYAGENFHLFFGVDRPSGNPDWLGEIFAWLSGDYERRVIERDAIGRIPFSHTVFAEQRISPRKPYAMMAMAWLQNEITGGVAGEFLPKAASPSTLAEHFVVCSHDVDFYFTSKGPALTRLLKNLAIAVRPYGSWSFFLWNIRQIGAVLAGKRVGEYLPALLEASGKYDFQSTIFAVAESSHRRDPNYRLDDLATDFRHCLDQGFSLGLHGSYQSAVENPSLRRESALLEQAFGVKASGVRQHWLRFAQHERFFEAVAGAGLTYDSTLGFAETAGFRNGACFAFPPYDFENERAYPFLEIPLALMDGSVEATARLSGDNPETVADDILEQSRKWGWGGIAADWHNPIEPIQVPEEINQVFWQQVRNQKKKREKWIDADQFLKLCLSRYQNAGLVPDVRLDA